MINIIAKFFCGLQINQEGNQTTNYSWLYSPAEATFKSKLEFDTLSVSIWKNGQQAQSMGQDEILNWDFDAIKAWSPKNYLVYQLQALLQTLSPPYFLSVQKKCLQF